MKKKVFLIYFVLLCFFMLTIKAQNEPLKSYNLKDVDGNAYNTIQIGDQIWMAENLKSTKYRNHEAIPLVTDSSAWRNLSSPGYCWYNNDSITYISSGALYNWYVVETGNLCPSGWHVPSHSEWSTLIKYLEANGYNYDGTYTENKIAKSLTTSTNWKPSDKKGAIGEIKKRKKEKNTGFSAQPSGDRCWDGKFSEISNINNDCSWWTSTEDKDLKRAISMFLYYANIELGGIIGPKNEAYSVRCIKD